MSEPDLRPDDVFFAIGFTGEDILGGAQLRAMELSSKNLEMMAVLQQQFGDLADAARCGLVVKNMIEVYSLDLFTVGHDTGQNPHGRKYLVVDFYNETAFTLSKLLEINLPSVIGKLVRAELPKHLKINRKAICFMLPSEN